jgi:hypothetical protein
LLAFVVYRDVDRRQAAFEERLHDSVAFFLILNRIDELKGYIFVVGFELFKQLLGFGLEFFEFARKLPLRTRPQSADL